MKKIVILLLIMVLLITGCKNSETKNNEHGNETVEEKKFDKISELNYIDIKCGALADIVDYSSIDSLFITKSGDIYQFSYDKLFSNDTNCKKIESDKKFKRFIRGAIIDSNNDIYSYDNGKNIVVKNNHNTTMPYLLDKISKNDYDNIIYEWNSDYNDYERYFYYDVDTNSIYEYSNKNYKKSENAMFNFETDEIVEYITYNGIKTNKAFYTQGRIAENANECEKYVDVECIYKNTFYKIGNETINKNLEHIKYIYYDNSHNTPVYFIVDENNNFYTNVMGG